MANRFRFLTRKVRATAKDAEEQDTDQSEDAGGKRFSGKQVDADVPAVISELAAAEAASERTADASTVNSETDAVPQGAAAVVGASVFDLAIDRKQSGADEPNSGASSGSARARVGADSLDVFSAAEASTDRADTSGKTNVRSGGSDDGPGGKERDEVTEIVRRPSGTEEDTVEDSTTAEGSDVGGGSDGSGGGGKHEVTEIVRRPSGTEENTVVDSTTAEATAEATESTTAEEIESFVNEVTAEVKQTVTTEGAAIVENLPAPVQGIVQSGITVAAQPGMGAVLGGAAAATAAPVLGVSLAGAGVIGATIVGTVVLGSEAAAAASDFVTTLAPSLGGSTEADSGTTPALGESESDDDSDSDADSDSDSDSSSSFDQTEDPGDSTGGSSTDYGDEQSLNPELDPNGQSTEPPADEADDGQSLDPELDPNGQSVEGEDEESQTSFGQPATGSTDFGDEQTLDPELDPEGQSVDPEADPDGQSVEPETGETEDGTSNEDTSDSGSGEEEHDEDGQSVDPELDPDGQSVEPTTNEDEEDEEQSEEEPTDDGDGQSTEEEQSSESSVGTSTNPDDPDRHGPPTEEELAFRKLLEDTLRPGGKTSGDIDPGDEDGSGGSAGVVGRSAVGLQVRIKTGESLFGNPAGVEVHGGQGVGNVGPGNTGPGFDGASGGGEIDSNSGPQGAQAKPDGPENFFSGTHGPLVAFPDSNSDEDTSQDDEPSKRVVSRFDLATFRDSDDSDDSDD